VRSPCEIEENPESNLEDVQRLALTLNRRKRVVRAWKRHVEFGARDSITADIEAHSDWSCRQHLDAAAVIQRELRTDLCKTWPAGLVLAPAEDGTHSGGDVRLRLRERSLNENVAVIEDGFRVCLEEIRSISNCMLTAENPGMTKPQAKCPERGRIETPGRRGRTGRRLQAQLALVLGCTKQSDVVVGVQGNRCEKARDYEKTSDIFHSAENYNLVPLMKSLISVLLVFLWFVRLGFGQVEEARQAIERGEYVRAVNILSATLADRPTPETYLYLGSAYRHMKEYQKAEDILNEGSKRYPNDPSFQNELANLFLENNDIQAAKSALRRALDVDPNDNTASDQLATIDMSEGDTQAALRAWNKSGRPYINDILHNYYLTFGSWVVRRALAFRPAGTLRYSEWKTTESRLFETDNFANVGLEIEPTRVPDQYNAVVRTTPKTNSVPNILFDLVKGSPWQTSYLNFWNIHNSGINFTGNYRWDAERRRAEGGIKLPLPIGSLLYVEFGNLWRSEQWDVSSNIRPDLQSKSQFLYKANAVGIQVKTIPNYRVELAAGFVYRNRAATGDLPELFTDSLNTGELTAQMTLRLVDRKYQNLLNIEMFAARRAFFGNTQFTGGTAQLKNRVSVSKDTGTDFNWSIQGGTARGLLPVENYFLLGVDTTTKYPLRGHTAAHHGKYGGTGPMGTDFVLLNTDIDRRLKTIPFFNNFNIPFIVIKSQFFFDAAKTWDRNHIFLPSKLLLDTGAALRFETPTNSFNLLYGRSLRTGKNVFTVYYERRLW